MEYEEILKQKLAPERWAWMAVHLANLYSGRLDQPEKAISLLRDLVDRYPETAAAAKAAKRLEMIDGS
jgi:TolA-binding protein